MKKDAIISTDKKYRYSLSRIWNEKLPLVAFVGLNPSTADDKIDDPTLIRCIAYAKKWQYGGVYMINLFAYRATEPSEMKNAIEPVGEENTEHIKKVISNVDKVICAWGNDGAFLNQNKMILSLIETPYCLKVNKTGEPAHPLYLKKTLEPIFYNLQ